MIAEAGALRLLVAAVLALATAFTVDRWTERRGFLPPGFARRWRRLAALAVLASILFLGIFLPVGLVGMERPEMVAEDVTAPALFLLQGLLLLSLGCWFVLGYAGTAAGEGRRSLPAEFTRQFGLRAGHSMDGELRGLFKVHGPGYFSRLLTRRPGPVYAELGIGVAAGVAGWVTVILLMVAVVAAVWALGGEDYLPKEPPELIPIVAGLPILVRVAIGVTAGVVEELFFRGFLQPRVGIALSTLLFVLAHLSYDQPFMLVGITALSLLFALLVRWRRNILAAIAAHAAFDLIQLLIVVPRVLEALPEVAG